jgi:aminopeptidase
MALDPRAKKLAEILVDYSVSVEEGESLIIRSEDSLKPFADYIEKLAFERGADTVCHSFINLTRRKALIERNELKGLEKESKKLCHLAEAATAAITVGMYTNPLYLTGVESKKLADFDRIVASPFTDRVVGDGEKFGGIKWVVAAYPTRGQAKLSGFSFDKYKDFVYTATNIDWSKTTEKMNEIKNVFDYASEVRVVAPKTDISFSLEDRGADVCNGKFNMPDGEVYYGPVEDSMQGKIYFPYETISDGNKIKGISLEYKNGEVIDFYAEENNNFLEAKLSLKGAKRVGEFGIGANYGIDRYTNRLLFDEKIGGTIHLALGNSYKRPIDNGGGKNVSDIHWDLVCDLRKANGLSGGKIFVDDTLVQENGIWKF